MKLKFLLPVLALIFILSCGDDPVSEADIDLEASDSSENIVSGDEDPVTGGDTENTLPDGNSTEPSDTESESADDEKDPSESSESDTETDDSETDDSEAEDAEGSDSDGSDTSDEDSGSSESDDADDSDPADTSDTDSGDTDTGDSGADTGDTGADTGDTGADTDSGEDEELTVVLPYNGASVDKTIEFGTEIKKIDVLLMVDLSGFITDAHDNLKANVKTAVIDGIRAQIPDSAFGLVKFGTIEQKNQYVLAQPITSDPNPVRNAVDGIAKVTSGSNTYHNLALWEAASGETNYEQIVYENSIGEPSYDRSFTIPAVDCSGQEGTIGGACFRTNAMPVFVMASAKAFIDLTKTYSWTNGGNPMKTKARALEKMNAINAKFIGFSLTGTSSSTNPANDFKYFAEGTKSQYLSDDNFNVIINADDTSLSQKIADAVKNLAGNIRLGVTAQFAHAENDYGVENTAQFVKSVYPEAGKTVKAGSPASFDITFGNNFYENTTCEPHDFTVIIKAVGEGIVLESRTVKVVVPANEDCASIH